jgi:hypothetical protein
MIEKALGDRAASPTPTPIPPNCHATDNDIAAIACVHQSTNGQTHEGIQKGEGEPRKQTKHGVAKTEISFDGTDQETEYLPVDGRERVAGNQNENDVPCVCAHCIAAQMRRPARVADPCFYSFRYYCSFRNR